MDMRGTFTENWPIKLVSLVLAVTLWFYVTSRGKTEVTTVVPLALRNVPQDMVVVGDVPASLTVRVQGQERALRDAALAKRIVGNVDLARAREGENRIHLSAEDVQTPAGVLVTHLDPFEISVRLDRIDRKTLRLKPVVTGRPAPGYRIKSVSVTPLRVTLEGPASVLGSFNLLRTLPVDASGMRESSTVEARIDFQGKPVKVLEQGITVTITLQKERP
jgi:YbbR domain-containing protein